MDERTCPQCFVTFESKAETFCSDQCEVRFDEEVGAAPTPKDKEDQ